ncbi:MAG: LuxR C-terminal-related transcriptional regulator [Bacteriodetes bacterium]|nr:LuxR C-terminal-related transcriptional regulator [Bacteroidota bacterium]
MANKKKSNKDVTIQRIGKFLEEAVTYVNRGLIDDALVKFTISLELSTKIKNQRLVFLSYDGLASTYIHSGDIENCFKYAMSALLIAQEEKDEELIARNNIVFSKLYYSMFRFDKAIEYTTRFYNYFREKNHIRGVITAMMQIAGINAMLNNTDEAIKIGEEALQVILDSGDTIHLEKSFIQLASFNITKMNYQAAEEYLDRALLLAQEKSSIMGKLSVYQLKAQINVDSKRYQQSINYAKLVLEQESTSPLFLSRCNALDIMCQSYIGLNDIASGILVAKQLNYELKQQNNPEGLYRYYRCMMKLDELKGDFKSSLHFAKLYHTTEKEIRGMQTQRKVDSYTTTFKFQQAEFIIQQEYLIAESLRQRLRIKNKELTTLALTIAQKNEMLLTLFVQLQETMNMIKGSESRNALQQIMNELLSELDTEKSWSEFSEKFTSLHKTFLATLQQQYPNLSQTEQRMCALLKINLSTKDIANILGFEENTIEVYRKRIRKKMGLDKSVNLVTHIASL